MARIGFEIVNCFAAQDFAGNPICVIRDPVEEALMGRIARQMGCTLTVFPVQTCPGSFTTRMFTVSREIPFGGSGALAAVWAMGEGRWTLSTVGGEVEAEYADGKAWTVQPVPTIERISDDDVAAAIGLSTIHGLFLGNASGNHHVVAVTDDDPADFWPQGDLLGKIASRYNGATVGAIQRIDAGEMHGRIFTPAHGIFEDPAVGGGAPTLAQIMHDHFDGADQCVIRQGEILGRPSRMEVILQSGGVKVGGGVRKAAEGALILD
jgi:trans-2,3-dihydro-3-hydroxyanthranilate isomerase